MKIWSHISAFLGGGLLIAIIFAKWFIGDDISVEVKRFKNKRTSGSTTTTIPINITKKERKPTRKERRAAKNKKK